MSEKAQFSIPHQELLDDVAMAYDAAAIPEATPVAPQRPEVASPVSIERQVCTYMVAVAKLLEEARQDAMTASEGK